MRLACLERCAGRKCQAAVPAEAACSRFRRVQVTAVKKVARSLDTALCRSPIEVLEQMEGMVGHAYSDVRRVIAFLRKSDSIDDLPFADEQLAMIF